MSVIPAPSILRHPTYHGSMTGEEATEALKLAGGAPAYLIRFSRQKKKLILSLVTGEDTFEHYGLSKENNQYVLDGAETTFPSIDALLEYYQNTPIDPTKPNTCVGRPCLREPNMEPLTSRRQSLRQNRQPLQTVREEPTQSEVMMQSLVETNKELMKLLQERCAKQDEMLERMSRKSCSIS